MKVVFLIDTLEVGGSEQSLLNILQRFTEVEPLVCHIYRGDALKPAFESAGIRVISLNIERRYAFQRAIGKVYTLLGDEKPAIVHTTLFRSDIVGRIAGRLAGIPVLSSFINEPYHAERWSSLAPVIRLKLFGVYALDRATGTLVWLRTSWRYRDQHTLPNCRALGIAPEKVTVIYRGRNPDPFLNVCADSLLSIRSELSLSPHAPVLLNVARALHRKGQLELIEAMPAVIREMAQVRLLIAGDGPDRALLEIAVRQYDVAEHVMLLGTRGDVPTLLSLADVFVFPSHYEGHPGALVEAMLAATPIVASDIPVHRVTIADGLTGRLVPVHDVAVLAETIVWMLSHKDEAHNMGRKAQQTALARYQIDSIAAQHELLYKQLTQGGTGL